jgi:hypothetical protein
VFAKLIELTHLGTPPRTTADAPTL